MTVTVTGTTFGASALNTHLSQTHGLQSQQYHLQPTKQAHDLHGITIVSNLQKLDPLNEINIQLHDAIWMNSLPWYNVQVQVSAKPKPRPSDTEHALLLTSNMKLNTWTCTNNTSYLLPNMQYLCNQAHSEQKVNSKQKKHKKLQDYPHRVCRKHKSWSTFSDKHSPRKLRRRRA